jgi:hypothetical protein
MCKEGASQSRTLAKFRYELARLPMLGAPPFPFQPQKLDAFCCSVKEKYDGDIEATEKFEKLCSSNGIAYEFFTWS